MNPLAFAPVVIAGIAVAFLHAATPTHWLPFVLVGRAQGWSQGRTLGVAAAAGLGHALSTALIGLAVTGAGLMIGRRLGELFPTLVGAGLIGLGGFYVVRHLMRPPHLRDLARRQVSDRTAILGLVALLTFMPSEAVLLVYLANTGFGWAGYAVLASALTAATTVGMVLFTGLFMAGAERLRLERLERYEQMIVGLALIALGAFVALEG